MEVAGLDGGRAELKEESRIRRATEAFGRGKYTLCYGYWCSRAGRGRCWAEENAGYGFGSSVWSYLSDKVYFDRSICGLLLQYVVEERDFSVHPILEFGPVQAMFGSKENNM